MYLQFSLSLSVLYCFVLLGFLFAVLVFLAYSYFIPVAAMLEQDTIPGVLGLKPTGLRKRTSSSFTVESILKQLDSFHSTLLQHSNDTELIRQVLKQNFYVICATTLNNLLLRKDMCSWSKGLQIRYWPQGVSTEHL